jgi:transposase
LLKYNPELMSLKEQSDIRRKLKVLNYAKQIKNITKACRYYGISRETFYQWKRAYEKDGEKALINQKPCPQNPKLRTPQHIEDLIIHLRKTYHLGQLRIISELVNGTWNAIMV